MRPTYQKSNTVKHFYWALILLATNTLPAQQDTLWVRNGNVLHGEIKGLSTGVLTMKTGYSKKDFSISYQEVVGLSIQRRCILTLDGGRRLVGMVRSSEPGKVVFIRDEGGSEELDLMQITGLIGVKERVWDRFYGNIDLGFNLTKANNNRQLTGSGGLHYRGLKWIMDFGLSALRSERDGVEKVERQQAGLSAVRLLSDRWYLLASANYLTNTEQQLDGRFGFRLGPGRYLALSNRLLWGVTGGVNYNVENFGGEAFDKESAELFFSTNLDLFDFSDFSLNTRVDLFPSLSEQGRFRMDYLLELTYDLPWDFYVKGGFQFNYDNQAVEAGSEFDYILTTGFGWSFD